MDRGLDFLVGGQSLSDIPDSGGWKYGLPKDPSAKFNNKTKINYRGQMKRNEVDPYKAEPDQHNVSFPELLKWSDKHKALRFKPIDFVYCENALRIPNNRMIVLRRFANPIGDNLFNVTGQSPIATIVSWVDPKEKEMISVSFNEDWAPTKTMVLNQVVKNLLSEGKKGFQEASGSMPDIPGGGFVVDSLANAVVDKFLQEFGVTQGSIIAMEGNPNLNAQTRYRKTGGEGLKYSLKFTFEARYKLRYIQGIDPQIAIADILGNIIQMGTSNAVYQLTGAFGSQVKEIQSLMENGRWGELVEKFVNAIKSVVGSITAQVKTLLAKVEDQGVVETVTEGVDELISAVSGFASEAISNLIKRHKIEIEAAVAALTGAPNAPWHLTIGNPKKPTFAAGNLIVDNVDLSITNDLSFDDGPVEIIAKITLSNAKPLGASEIASCFNAGNGRIYANSINDIQGGKEEV